MLHCHDYQYFLPTQRRFFLASNKSFWNICWVSSGAVKVFGTDSTLPDLVSWNKYTTHLFFKVYINRQKHRFCCQAIPSFPFNSSHETWVTEDAPELVYFFSGEPITSAPACKMMSFFCFFLGRHSNLFKKYVLSPVQSILFCMDSFRPSRAATVGRT